MVYMGKLITDNGQVRNETNRKLNRRGDKLTFGSTT